jgi:hypothetical protein
MGIPLASFISKELKGHSVIITAWMVCDGPQGVWLFKERHYRCTAILLRQLAPLGL